MFIDGSLLADYLIIGISILVFVSFVAGFLDSIAGGAGLVLVPAFILTGMPPQLALGQEKLVSTLGTISAIYNYFKNGKIIWKVVGYGIPTALIGAYLGGKVILAIDESIVGKIIFFMIPIGLLFSFMPKRTKSDKEYQPGKKDIWIVLPLTCFVIGFYDGFFGPGTGSLLILALHFLARMPLIESSATSKIFNFASNVGAFVAFAIAGKMAFLISIPMVVGSIAGNYLGSHLTLKNGEKIIKPLIFISISILFISLGIKYII
ncbi:TSUP family transporter [Candidatus Haliotispira prima]|uniref:Probable membrane transporter protein n=1 Tax=Candidatus Haliotispira prima TaxID=3034016 RepID=A0ABY8MHW5_9SPIO|nr:TSUP family transporter [Candidatus Haliotispira prima]